MISFSLESFTKITWTSDCVCKKIISLTWRRQNHHLSRYWKKCVLMTLRNVFLIKILWNSCVHTKKCRKHRSNQYMYWASLLDRLRLIKPSMVLRYNITLIMNMTLNLEMECGEKKMSYLVTIIWKFIVSQ